MDEVSAGPRHYARNYQRVFEGLGMRQILYRKKVAGLLKSFQCRIVVHA